MLQWYTCQCYNDTRVNVVEVCKGIRVVVVRCADCQTVHSVHVCSTGRLYRYCVSWIINTILCIIFGSIKLWYKNCFVFIWIFLLGVKLFYSNESKDNQIHVCSNVADISPDYNYLPLLDLFTPNAISLTVQLPTMGKYTDIRLSLRVPYKHVINYITCTKDECIASVIINCRHGYTNIPWCYSLGAEWFGDSRFDTYRDS